ncbi:TPA: hypothetical protein MEC06_000912 [Klebsiella pneumoniae]|uniref:hypothetical protein n=1 Tax=Klebsiella pneumoniae TaxID=573 RepID=UPI0003FD4CFF|nr:hypothetical protein [Klebsiella pneumoniae]HDU5903438.1 hypothetical protein [Klebsiella pneumoniae subsp. pneumoniae]HBT3722580.1 hypothetical protein [Klebsiella pneumoniae]HBT4566567.1 hypothetical protein [Klebsiella pneumoniae]HBT4684535.1 hypothetical protein [Klebsiella pneumoniae]
MDAVFPAPAGINRHDIQHHQDGSCVPRASGDKPTYQIHTGRCEECSPRQRG